jgi:hypothetical protein
LFKNKIINPNKIGVVVAALIGGWHLVWAALVAAGWAQPLLNFIFWAHMIRPVYVVGPFDVGAPCPNRKLRRSPPLPGIS